MTVAKPGRRSLFPAYVSGVYNLTVTPGSVLWLGTREGAMRSTDGGQSWHYIVNGLPKSDVLAVHYDAAGQRLLATALHTHGVFESKDGGQTWQLTAEARVSIRSAMNFQGRLLGSVGSQRPAAGAGRRRIFGVRACR